MELAKEAAGRQRPIADSSRNSSAFSAAWSIPRAGVRPAASVLKCFGSGKLVTMCFASKLGASPSSFRILCADEGEAYSGAYSWAFAWAFCWTAVLRWGGKTLQHLAHQLGNIWGKHFLKRRATTFLEGSAVFQRLPVEITPAPRVIKKRAIENQVTLWNLWGFFIFWEWF